MKKYLSFLFIAVMVFLTWRYPEAVGVWLILLVVGMYALLLVEDYQILLGTLLRDTEFGSSVALKKNRGRGSSQIKLNPQTTCGITLARAIEAFKFRLEGLQWQMEASQKMKQKVYRPTEQNLENEATKSRQILEETVRYLQETFRCRVAAIAIGDDGPETVVYSKGIEEQRFRHQVALYFQGYLSAGYLDCFGDLNAEGRSLVRDFSSSGIQRVFCAPLPLSANVLGGKRAALILGYSAERLPYAGEQQMFRECVIKIAAELENSYKLLDLRHRVARAENQVEKKSEFLAQMSHDLRTPLNNVRAILSVFEERLNQGEDASFFDAAVKNCDAVGEMLENVLEYSRQKAGKLSLKPESFDLVLCLEDVVAAYRPQALQRALSLEVDNQSPTQAWIFADRLHIRRVLSNIIGNAIKYTQCGGVTIAVLPQTDARKEVNTWTVLVRDTGMGLSEEQMKQLFQPFTRFCSSTVEGTGLGLALCKSLLEINKSKISVRSSLGRGTLFEIAIPASLHSDEGFTQDQARKLRSTPIPFPNAPREANLEVLQGVRVLLVDDDADSVAALNRVLTKAGALVQGTTSVSDAMSIYNFEPPDCVVTDFSMPERGGERLLSFIKSSAHRRPVIVLSGSLADPSSVMATANRVLLKPCDMRMLIQEVARLAGVAQSERSSSAQGAGRAMVA